MAGWSIGRGVFCDADGMTLPIHELRETELPLHGLKRSAAHAKHPMSDLVRDCKYLVNGSGEKEASLETVQSPRASRPD